MISLLPMGRVIGFISVLYASLIALATALAWKIDGHSQTIWGSIGMALSGATALQLFLMTWFYFGWKHLWRWMPILNRLFPDLGGAWKMKISWQWEGRRGVIHAEAIIKQDFLRLSMEVKSPKSDSQTLIAQPKRQPESGRPYLYYIYLVTPSTPGSDPYYGVAILKFSETGGGELTGNYWTSQRTAGHFELSRETDIRPSAP
jgi:hypothetical protein